MLVKRVLDVWTWLKMGYTQFWCSFSATSRFSREDASTIETIKVFFGEKIVDHMMLDFGYGDLVGESKLKNVLKNALEYF